MENDVLFLNDIQLSIENVSNMFFQYKVINSLYDCTNLQNIYQLIYITRNYLIKYQIDNGYFQLCNVRP